MPVTEKKKEKFGISLDKLEKLKGLIVQDRERDYNETQERRNNLKLFIKMMDGLLPKEKDHESWMSTISLKSAYAECETLGVRQDLALSDNKLVVMKPTSKEDVEIIAQKEEFFNYYLNNCIKDFDEQKDRSILTNTRLGNSVLYSYYERTIIPDQYKDVFLVNKDSFLDDMICEQACQEIIINKYKDKLLPDGIERIDLFKYKVKYLRKTPVASIKDEIKDVAIYDFYPNEKRSMIEVKITENNIKYDGVVFKTLPIDNVWFPSTIVTNEDLQNCDHIGIEFKTSYSEIARLQADGCYDLLTKDDLAMFENALSSVDDNGKNNLIKKEVQTNAGVKESSETDKSNSIRFYEEYRYFDINDDGYDEHIFITYFPDQNLFGRVRYLSEVIRSGERPIDITCFGLREDSIFGYGGLELLFDLQDEYDTLHNQFINYNTLSNTPFGLVKNDSLYGTRLEKKETRIKPMILLPTDNPREDVYFPHVPTNHNWNLADMSLIKHQMQELIGSSDLMKGKEQFSRTGVGLGLKMLSEVSLRPKQYLKRYNRSFKSHLRKIYQLMRDYGPEIQVYRVMNQNGKWKTFDISRSDLKELPDFELGTSIDNLNKVYMREAWILLLQQQANPVDLQMGLIQPHNRYNLWRKVYDSYDIKDYQYLISAPPINQPMSQEDEIDLMRSGVRVQVNPLDIDKDHLRILDEFQADLNQIENFPSQYSHLITQHIEDHLNALEMKQLQEQQQKQLIRNELLKQQINPVQPAIQRPKAQPMMPSGTQLPQTTQ